MATPMWEHRPMEGTEAAVTDLRAAVRDYDKAKKAVDKSRDHLGRVIAAALTAGVKPKVVRAETGMSAEHIRRIAREHDVPRLREPTVTSRRKAALDDS